jgi:hypothetical protein
VGLKANASRVVRGVRALGLRTTMKRADYKYAALPEYRLRCAEGFLDDSLSPYEFKLFSQNGEDGIITEIFRRIGCENRSFIEFGIQSGHEGNCVALADVAGWSGVFVEPDPVGFASLSHKYSGNPHVQTWNEFVTPENINELFSRDGIPEDLDLLSIDIDGADFWVYKALTVIRPRVVIIEYNGAFPLDSTIAQSLDYTDRAFRAVQAGCSLGALECVAADKGYRLAYTDLSGLNAFFVRNDLFDGLGITSVPRRAANYFLSDLKWELPSDGLVDVAEVSE